MDSEAGDKTTTEFAFAEAAHVVRLETLINRVTGVPMELRAAVGVYDEVSARYGTQRRNDGTNSKGGVILCETQAAVKLLPAAGPEARGIQTHRGRPCLCASSHAPFKGARGRSRPSGAPPRK